MEAKLTVNGFGFVARYGEKDVERVLLPLLMRLTELQAERSGRLIAFLAAPPGAGKSTLAAFMEWLSRRTPEATPLQAVGMDGFHYPNAYLDAHSFVDEDGREVGMRSRKGAPQTFDVEGLRAALADARGDAPAPWPTYSRVLHDVVAASLPIRKKILLVEGNYLLLDEGRWTGLAELARLHRLSERARGAAAGAPGCPQGGRRLHARRKPGPGMRPATAATWPASWPTTPPPALNLRWELTAASRLRDGFGHEPESTSRRHGVCPVGEKRFLMVAF